MTAPSLPVTDSSQDELTQLLDLSDTSRVRTQAIEDQTESEIDQIYAQYATQYRMRTSPAQQGNEDEHPFLNVLLLTAVTAVLRRAFAKGEEEGRRFAQEQVGVVGGQLAAPQPLDERPMRYIISDFVSGQKELAVGKQNVDALYKLLSNRAKLAAVTSIQTGRSMAVEQELKTAIGSWTGQVHKLWVARFDLNTPPCPFCTRLHGMHVPVEDNFPAHKDEPAAYLGDINHPPRHPNCRCSLVLYLPATMGKTKVGPTPLSMMQYGNEVLSLLGAPTCHEFVAATMVWVKPYSRTENGKVHFVKGYYFDIKTGRKVLGHAGNLNYVPGSPNGPDNHSRPSIAGIRSVHVTALHKLASVGSVPSSGRGPGKSKFGAGVYHIHLPDGTTSQLKISEDGSGTATHLGKLEKVDKFQAEKFLTYWSKLGKLQSPDHLESNPSAPVIGDRGGVAPSATKPLILGGKELPADHVKKAISILQNEKSTSVKGPLRAAGSSLAEVDLRKVAEDHAGSSLHYSRLRKGVIDALQHHLDSHSSDTGKRSNPSTVENISSDLNPGRLSDSELASELSIAHENLTRLRTAGTPVTSPSYVEVRDKVQRFEEEVRNRERSAHGDSALIAGGASALPVGSAAPSALPRQERAQWSDLLKTAKTAFPITPSDRGSALASGLQKVASTRHRHYVDVNSSGTSVSMKQSQLDQGSDGHSYMIHSNGSVWQRHLDNDGVERLTPVSHGRVSQMTSSHLSSVDGLSLEKALTGVRSLDDSQLEQFMQRALATDNMDAFEKLAAEADRRDRTDQKRRDQEESRAARLEQLIGSGMSEEVATENVYGVTVEKQRRQAAISSLRNSGYTGVNLSELARKAYKDYIYNLYLQAETDMQGHMLTKEGESKGIHPMTLFSGPESRVAKYSSPELKDWFELHGRLGFKDWLDSYLGKFGYAKR